MRRADAPQAVAIVLVKTMEQTPVRPVVSAVVAIALSVTMTAARQSPQGDPASRFEAASVKPSDPSTAATRVSMTPTRVLMIGVSVRQLIREAFRLQDYQIVDAPSWIDRERFDIVARPPEGSDPRAVPAMLRSLLADRWNMSSHAEMREMPIYALVRAHDDRRLGAGLKASSAACQAIVRARDASGAAIPAAGGTRTGGATDPAAPPECGFARAGRGVLMATGQPIGALASSLAIFTRRAVIDRTGLDGLFDLTLTWTPEDSPAAPSAGAASSAVPSTEPESPGLFTALQEQLGLRLESRRGPAEALVVDRIERPSAD